MSGLRKFINEVHDRLGDIQDDMVEGSFDHAGELVRDLSEYVERIHAAVCEPGATSRD